MKVVVTGASGNIGKRIVARLQQNGVNVVGVSRQNIRGNKGLDDYAKSPSGDVVIHCGQPSDVSSPCYSTHSERSRLAHTSSNLCAGKYDKVVFISSAAVYGDTSQSPRSTASRTIANTGYAKAKAQTEEIVLNNNGIVLRLSNIYNDDRGQKNIFGHIVRQSENSHAVFVKKSTPVRDFLWVEDAVDAILCAISSNNRGIFNVGSGVGVSILELIKMFDQQLGFDRQVISSEHDSSTSNLVLDINQTIVKLGWRPKTTLESGIEALVAETLNRADDETYR
jgi:UDP-glucose 4-epimerase